LVIFLTAFSLLAAKFVRENTQIVPVAGGNYIEGVVSQPSFINPILAANDADRDLTELAFDDLSELAESYKMEDNGKKWRYRLKEGIFWHDGEKITTDDIIFTVETIKNPDVYSPLYSNWQSIETSRVSERELEFKLPAPYVFFEDTLKNLKPVPKHIFGNIPATNIKLSNYNFEPIGSGPFKFKSFSRRADGYISSYVFEKNEAYQKFVYLKKISFNFYTNEVETINAFNMGEVDGFGLANPENLGKIAFSHKVFPIRMLKYYAIFLNQLSHPALKDKNVRLAMTMAIDKMEIIEKVFNGQAVLAAGPLVEGMEGFDKQVYSENVFSAEKANQILESMGWEWNNEENVREGQINDEIVKLEFNLSVPEISFLIETANLIKGQLAKIGVKINLSIAPISEINNKTIKNRDYQIILFGNILGDSPDLFSFWHSSGSFYPGLNLSLYGSKTADSLIETIRKDFDEQKKQSELSSLQYLIIGDYPAIFLYSPNYLYIGKKSFSGFEDSFISFSSERLKSIENWYTKTARSLKNRN